VRWSSLLALGRTHAHRSPGLRQPAYLELVQCLMAKVRGAHSDSSDTLLHHSATRSTCVVHCRCLSCAAVSLRHCRHCVTLPLFHGVTVSLCHCAGGCMGDGVGSV